MITDFPKIRRTLIQLHHNPPVYGHPGINRTIRLIERHYWWPNLCKEVTKYVQGCAECQRHKVNNHPIKAPLSPIYPTPEALPFEMVTLDFITKLPESQGYDFILTITDHNCTKMAVKRSTQKRLLCPMQNMYSPHMDFLLNSSVIETLALCPSSQGNSAKSWGLHRTFPQPITLALTDSQNAPISG